MSVLFNNSIKILSNLIAYIRTHYMSLTNCEIYIRIGNARFVIFVFINVVMTIFLTSVVTEKEVANIVTILVFLRLVFSN